MYIPVKLKKNYKKIKDKKTPGQVTRHQAGVYTCRADNGVGPPITDNIAIRIFCKSLSGFRSWAFGVVLA